MQTGGTSGNPYLYVAVKAGLLMAANVQKLHEDMPVTHRLRFGIGVNTGPAVLGNVGSPRRKEFTAIGNSLQLAKLLQENAKGGESAGPVPGKARIFFERNHEASESTKGKGNTRPDHRIRSSPSSIRKLT